MKGGGVEFILQTKRNEAKGGRERALKDAGVSSRHNCEGGERNIGFRESEGEMGPG